MKKNALIMGIVALSFLTISANAQSDTKPVQPAPTDTVNRWNPKNNPAVAEINDKYKDKYVITKPTMTTNDIYPVLGQYESSTNPEAAVITIMLDAENKGIVWITGLPQGKVKAMLRKSPAIYKIPAQKTEDGKDVAEGTAIYDKDTKTLSMIIGKQYNAADPTAAFVPVPEEVTVKTKTVANGKKTKTKNVIAPIKPWIYTGTKVEKAMVIN